MNETEAKSKWCPESRVRSPTGAYNREAVTGTAPRGAMCLGHGCMQFVVDREAYDNAVYAFEESRGQEGGNVVSIVGGKAKPVEGAAQPVEPDIRDFYKCGKVFPDIL